MNKKIGKPWLSASLGRPRDKSSYSLRRSGKKERMIWMKKTWKRWSALLLAVVMTLSLLPTAALAAREEQAEAPLGEEVSTGNRLSDCGCVCHHKGQ